MALTLSQFEQIDGLMASLLRMGEFETCADPRGYIRTSNMLGDAIIDALGYQFHDDFSCSLEAAAHIVSRALIGSLEVVDEEVA